MINDQHKTLHKVVSNTIKNANGCPLEFALDKISCVNFCKLAQITKKLIISGRLCLSLRYTLRSTSSTRIHLLIPHRV